MPQLKLEVVYSINDTPQPTHLFVCDHATRRIHPDGSTIVMVNGVHMPSGRRIAAAQYRQCEVILSYLAEEQGRDK